MNFPIPQILQSSEFDCSFDAEKLLRDMDVELARTFLAIVETRSFMKAADLLHVGQTAVSARVRTLETQLGRQLFVRNRGGVTLTAAVRQFLYYAPSLVRLWQRARHRSRSRKDIAQFWPWASRPACGAPGSRNG